MKVDYTKYDLDFEPGATEEAIHLLVNTAPGRLPDDYLDFLRFSNGAFGTSLYLYPIEDILDYSKTEWVQKDIPGFLVIGSDGGGEAYGYNLNVPIPEIVMTPFIGGRWENAILLGTSFVEFLEKAIIS